MHIDHALRVTFIHFKQLGTFTSDGSAFEVAANVIAPQTCGRGQGSSWGLFEFDKIGAEFLSIINIFSKDFTARFANDWFWGNGKSLNIKFQMRSPSLILHDWWVAPGRSPGVQVGLTWKLKDSCDGVRDSYERCR